MKFAKWLQLSAIIFVFSNLLFAQSQPNTENGVKSFGSYTGSDIDTVNLQNGNVMLHIPLFSYPQRGGLGLGYSVQLNSKNWQVGQYTGASQSQHYRWMLSGQPGLFLTSSYDVQLQRVRTITTYVDGGQSYQDGNYAVRTPDGAIHWLAGMLSNGNMVTQDGSNFQFTLTPGTLFDHSDDSGALKAGNGTVYHYSNLSRSRDYMTPLWGTSANVIAHVGEWRNTTMAEGNNTVQTFNDTVSPTSIVDANGNTLGFSFTVNADGSTTVGPATDSKGQLIPFATGNLGATATAQDNCATLSTISGAYLFNFPAPDNRVSPITLCYTSVALAPVFSQPNVEAPKNDNLFKSYPPGSGGAPVGSLAMPDGTKWAFAYDAYGNITTVNLPTGGVITYEWTEAPLPACQDGNTTAVSRAVFKRHVNDLINPVQTWQYTWGTIQGDGSITNYVLDPKGNETAHVFKSPVANLPCALYETETRTYQGDHLSGTLLKTVDTHFTGTMSMNDTVSFAASVVADTITTTLPGNKISKIVRQYDGYPANTTFGKVIDEKVYDYGTGGPGLLLRETATTYQWQADPAYLNAGLLDLPASAIVTDGSGCKMAETDYAYDESAYANVNYESTVGTLPAGTHQAVSTPRGNLTTTKHMLFDHSQCVPTAQSAVSSNTIWYDTGEAHQHIDPLGHITTVSYDVAYDGMLATQTCSPQTSGVSHCVSGTYDFITGLLKSFTSENATAQASGNSKGDSAHTSNFGYDTSWRLTSAQAPPDPANGSANAQTIFNFGVAYPFTIQKQKSITTAMSDFSTVYLDGVGRAYHTEHVVPGGPAKVDTSFDGLGQATSVSNPYFTTSDATYGVTQPIYDGLGRTTKITKQDSSISKTAYSVQTTIAVNGDCVQTTDEAGNQRGACSDALGRLVEVDEPNPGVQVSVSNHATLQTDGNFVLYNPVSSALWSTGTSGTNASGIFMQDDANLVLYIFKWQAGTYLAPTGGTIPYDGCRVGSSLFAGQILASGACLESPSGRYMLLMQSDGNLFIYDRSAGHVTWAANTYGHPGAYASLQSDGNFVVYNTSGVGIWSSGTYNTFSERLDMADDGRIIIYKSAWNSGTSNGSYNWPAIAHPACDAGPGTGWTGVLGAGQCFVSPNGRFELLMQSDGNLVIYDRSVTPNHLLWSTGTAISPADPGFAMRTIYSYDALGNLLRVDQKGTAPNDSTQWRTRTFTYDSLSRLLTATNPESGLITYSYDADGNLLQKTSPAPNQTGTATQTVSYCYDALHRVTGKGYGAQSCPLAAPVVTYAYDSGTNAIGHLTSLTDQAGTASYSYDVLGRLIAETRVISGVSKSMSYSYNLDGSLKTLTNPSNAVITYTPDSAGRILSAVDSGNSINYVTGATYGPDSGLTGFISGNSGTFAGITSAFSYNKRLQPVNMSANAPSQTVFYIGYDFHFGAGNNGNVFGITNYKDSNRTQTFTYDALNRLASAQNAGTNCAATVIGGKSEYWGNSYGYDAWGNLLNKSVTKCSAENLSVAALPNNQLTGYGYDAAGNMTSDPTDGVTLSYDQENRITGAAGYTYTYDADGNRVKKSNGSTGTLYWYMTPGIVGESDLNGNLTDEYVFFGGERVARKSTNGVFYYFSDHLKTASVITDAAGVIKAESDFYPWGGELQFVNNDSNHYKFTGKERDAETQLDYFGARHYSNGLGRWVSADWSPTPIPVPYADFGDPQSLNLYGFVGGNPASKADPDGHDPYWYGAPILMGPESVKDAFNTMADFVDFALHRYQPHAGAFPPPQPCPCPESPRQDNKNQNNNNSNQQSSTEQGRDAQGKFTSKQPGQSAPGAAAEREALEAAGATKNTEAIPGSNRIPDGKIENAAGKVEQYVEGKSGASVSNTAQLRQMATAAMKATGKPLKLVTTNPNVKIANTVLRNKNIEIVRLKQK